MSKCLSSMWLNFLITDNYSNYTVIITNKVIIKLNSTKQLNQKQSKVKAKEYSLFTL